MGAVRETAELRDQFHQQETELDDLQATAAGAKSVRAEVAIQKATIDALEAKIETLEVDLQKAESQLDDPSSSSSSSSDDEEEEEEVVRATVVQSSFNEQTNKLRDELKQLQLDLDAYAVREKSFTKELGDLKREKE